MRMKNQKGQSLLAVLLAALLAAPLSVGSAAAQSSLVTHPGNDEAAMRRARARAIFLGTLTRWESGRPIVVFVLPPDHPTTKDFAWNVLGVAPAAFEEKISAMAATRDGNAPRVLDTEQEMLRAVATTPNSIGYLNSFIVINNAKSNIRVVPIL